MNRLFHILRSELALSLLGGFALGLVALSLVKPASADSGNDAGRAISVYSPDVVIVKK